MALQPCRLATSKTPVNGISLIFSTRQTDSKVTCTSVSH